MKKKLLVFLAAVVMVIPIALGLGSSLTAEAAGTVDIILHKKRFSSAQTEIKNTGELMSQFNSAPGFGGVEFKVYDVTNDFYTLLNTVNTATSKKYTMEEALAKVKTEDYSGKTAVKSGTTATTGSVGDLTLAGLADKVGGKNAVYVIVETPMAGVTIADNMVVALPLTKADGSTPLTEIHLYPKNVVETAGIDVEKISNLKDSDGNKIPLEDVKFVIHRKGVYNATGTEYLSGFDASDTPTWSTDPDDAHKFETDEYGKFTEDRLLYGTYYLTEVSTIPGYTIQNGAVNQQFTLDEDHKSKSFAGTNAIENDDIDVKKTNVGGSVNVGDKINYKVETVIPNGIKDQIDKDGNGVNDAPRYIKYEIKDTHGTHLKLDNTSLVLTDGTNTFTAPTDYTLDEATSGEFTVKFTAAGIAKMTPNATLTMTYKMELLQTIAPGTEVNNTAKVATDHDTDEGSGSEVYTGGYNFIKVDGSNDNEALAGAEFVVRDANSDSAKYLKVGTNGEITWVADESDATPFTSGPLGYVTIKGLKNGTYYLEETKAPNDKYVLLTDRVEFTVSKNSFDTTDPLKTGTAGIPEVVTNKQKGSLPSTGGSGIYLMMAAGVAVMAIVGVAYLRAQRKEA